VVDRPQFQIDGFSERKARSTTAKFLYARAVLAMSDCSAARLVRTT
jgi:hypothetical protein